MPKQPHTAGCTVEGSSVGGSCVGGSIIVGCKVGCKVGCGVGCSVCVGSEGCVGCAAVVGVVGIRVGGTFVSLGVEVGVGGRVVGVVVGVRVAACVTAIVAVLVTLTTVVITRGGVVVGLDVLVAVEGINGVHVGSDWCSTSGKHKAIPAAIPQQRVTTPSVINSVLNNFFLRFCFILFTPLSHQD